MSLTSHAVLFVSLALTVSAMVVKPYAFDAQRAAFLAVSSNASKPGKYGKGGCKCVGIDNLKGYFSMPLAKSHVQYPIEVGASCEAWEEHPSVQWKECSGKGKDAPAWCSQKWCYVDPCSCDLEIIPKRTETGITFKGTPAYWSYDTCGGKDTYSGSMVKDACVNQKSEGKCSKLDKCAWDGKQCGGKELIETCKAETKLDEAVVGKEDCRCVGMAGKNGIAKMHINSSHEVDYHADVGGRCAAWEEDAHPACQDKGDTLPSWCKMKWCWVDPCKCKTSTPPKATMAANKAFQFQGAIAHWSYETCGSKDAWSSEHADQYCHTQKSADKCGKLDKCLWKEEKCLTKEVAEICNKPKKSGAYQVTSAVAMLLAFASFA